MGRHAQGGRVSGSSSLMDSSTTYLWGPFSRLGLAAAAVICALDQALKLWLIFVFDLPAKGTVALAPFVALVMTWNTGISYGWFQQEGPFGQWALFALKLIAVALLWIWIFQPSIGVLNYLLSLVGIEGPGWLQSTFWEIPSVSIIARAGSRFAALSLGLIIGGALGNGIDLLIHGAVADFVLLHVETPSWRFNWYVFNLADVAIVAGVAGLLYESVLGDRAAKAP